MKTYLLIGRKEKLAYWWSCKRFSLTGQWGCGSWIKPLLCFTGLFSYCVHSSMTSRLSFSLSKPFLFRADGDRERALQSEREISEFYEDLYLGWRQGVCLLKIRVERWLWLTNSEVKGGAETHSFQGYLPPNYWAKKKTLQSASCLCTNHPRNLVFLPSVTPFFGSHRPLR